MQNNKVYYLHTGENHVSSDAVSVCSDIGS